MKKIFFISFALFVFIACSHKMSSSTSSSTAKPKADANALYISDIKPVLEIKCSPCHFPDKGGFKASLASYDSASKYIVDMVRRVQLNPTDHDYMPFKGKRAPLTPTEIASFKAWQAALGK